MALFEDRVLTDTIEINTTPENVFQFLTSNEFIIEPKEEICLFTASGTYRIGWIGKKLFKKKLDEGLASIKKHMKEEGENLKRILENGE